MLNTYRWLLIVTAMLFLTLSLDMSMFVRLGACAEIKESTTLELDYNWYLSVEKAAEEEQASSVWNNGLNLNRTIEKWSYGNWQKVDLQVNTSKPAGGKSKTMTEWKAELGGKKYLANSPYYLFSSLLGDQSVTTGQEQGEGVHSMIIAGTGGGRVVDLANYVRAKRVEGALLKEGLLGDELPRETFTKLIEILRRKKRTMERVIEVSKLLSGVGLLKVEKFDVDTAFLIAEIIDKSTDRLQAGFEARVGYAQELSQRDEGQENTGLVTAMAKFAKPLSDRLEFTVRTDFFKSLTGEERDIRDIDLALVPQLKYDLTRTQVTGTYTFHVQTYKGDRDSDSDHRFDVKYTYQVLNRINLSVSYAAQSQQVRESVWRSRQLVQTTETKWSHQLIAQAGYEIF